MANTAKDTFIDWLRDAHALEKKLVPELKKHQADAKEHPEVQSKLQQHIEETERHAQTIEAILRELGADPSALKQLAGHATAVVSGAVTSLSADTIVKNALVEFTMENTEIASYISLIAAAEHLHLPQAVQRLRGILSEEEEMAEWLRQQIDRITISYLGPVNAPVGV